MNDSNGNNNINENNNTNNYMFHHNQKIITTSKHFLDYLPNTLVKLIFEKDAMFDEKVTQPLQYKFNSCFLFVDISEIKYEYLNNNNNLTKENYEYIYSYINRKFEQLASIFTELGYDIIFYGAGLLSFISPDFEEEIYNDTDNFKIMNKILKMVQCAYEIKKNFFETENFFKMKIGISYGECTLIIFKDNFINFNYIKNEPQSFKNLNFINSGSNAPNINLYQNTKNMGFKYIFLGQPIISCCQYAKEGEEGQITIDHFIYNFISEFFEAEEIEIENKKIKLYKLLKQTQSLKMQNKVFVNNKYNYSDKQIISKKDIIINFFPNYFLKTISGGYIINTKWLKETRYITILILRPIMRSQDINNPEKLGRLLKIINDLINELGGLFFKIMHDEKGIMIMIVFGLIKYMSVNKDELISVIFAFDLTKKLKEINIYPYIGISSNLINFNLNKFSGNRRDFNIIGDAYVHALQCLEECENIYGKHFREDPIIIDKNTMDIIDSIIPCKFIKKTKNNFSRKEIFLFIPLKVNKIENINKNDNIIPLLGSHLHIIPKNIDIKEEDIKIIEDKKYCNFYDKNLIIHFVNLLKNFLENNTKIKLIIINGLTGSGKTLFLSQGLNSFFRYYPIIKDMLYYKNIKNDYPFLFLSNLSIVIYSKTFNEYNKKEFKAIQHIMKEIFNYLYEEINEKFKIINLIKKNNCIEYINFLGKFFGINELKNNFDNKKEVDKTKISLIGEEDRNNIFSLFIDIINEYYNFINNINKDKLTLYNIRIPIIIIIESINLCDKYSLEFFKYYLNQNIDSNKLLFIATNSISTYPQYIYQNKNAINPFYKFNNNPFLYQYEISILNGKEKMNNFIINFFKEKKDLSIEKIDEKIINFLIYKTYGGIQEQVIKLIAYLYDNKYIYIKDINGNKSLVINEEFDLMIKQNDFIDIVIPYSIERNLGYIINKELNIEEIALLRICSVLGDLFDTVKLSKILKNNGYSFINNFNDYWKNKNNCSTKEFNLYEIIFDLEQKHIIEILSDNQINHKFVVCKFSIPFMREVIYQYISLDQRNELHYIIGKSIKFKIDIKKDYIIYKYYSNELELLNLKKHLRKMEIFMQDYNMRKINKFENNISNKDEENFSLNNLKTIIMKEISNKLINSKNDKNTLIKSGYLEKKSNVKITYEKRFFVLTPNKLSYYYEENNYKMNEPALGFFYLRNLNDVKVLRNNGKFIFCLTVNKWIKKKELMNERLYFLGTDKWENLYSWTISLKILKINAFYNSFCSNFCFVKFPLFETGKQAEKSELSEYTFNLKVDNEENKNKKIRMTKRVGIYEKCNGRKMSILSNIFCLGLKESDSLKKRTNHLYIEIIFNYLRFIFKYSFSTILNNIQVKISQFRDICNYEGSYYDFIENHSLFGKYENDMENMLDIININNENLRTKIEEERKNILFYSDKANKFESQKYEDYLLQYFPMKKYNEPMVYKVRDLKKISDYNRIITSKTFDEIEFIDEEEEEIRNEDNLRFGDFVDITSPFPLGKLSSTNNFFNNLNNEIPKRKSSFVLKCKGEGAPISYMDRKKKAVENKQPVKNILSFLENSNFNKEKNKSLGNYKKTQNNILDNDINFNSVKIKKNMTKENKSIKRTNLYSDKDKNSKKNNNSLSSSMNSSDANYLKEKKNSKQNINGEREIINEKFIVAKSNKIKEKNNSIEQNTDSDEDEDFDFGNLLKKYTNDMEFLKNKSKETKKNKKISKKDLKSEKNKVKLNNKKNIEKVSVKSNEDYLFSNKTSKKSSEKSFNSQINSKNNSNTSKKDNNINKNNNVNKDTNSNDKVNHSISKDTNSNENINHINKNSNSIGKKSKGSKLDKKEDNISNQNSQKNEYKIDYNSKNNSFKNINSIHSNSIKIGEIYSKKSEKIEINSLYSEKEEPSFGNINSNEYQFEINNNSILNNNISDRNNHQSIKKEKNNYNPFLISFFSKEKNISLYPKANIPQTDRIRKSDRYLKSNQNLKLWLLLNKSKEQEKNNNSNITNEFSFNLSSKDESFNLDKIENLNESYSYIKNFIFDNHNIKQRCQLRKKVLIGLNKNKSVINISNKKYKNNSHLEMIQKLKNKSVSLDQEKEYLGYFKDILNQSKHKKNNDYNKINNTSRSKSSHNFDNSTSNNTYREQFYYPNVSYLNYDENLHKKIHVSHLFSKLKANNKLK